MVSSLWVLSDSIGGYLGDTLGSLAYDKFGFEDGSVIMAVIMILSVGLILIYLLCRRFLSRDKHEASQEERKGRPFVHCCLNSKYMSFTIKLSTGVLRAALIIRLPPHTSPPLLLICRFVNVISDFMLLFIS